MWPFPKKPVLENTPFGQVTFRRGTWEGLTQLPHPNSDPVFTQIHAPKYDDFSATKPIRLIIDTRYETLAAQIKEEAVATYRMYADEGLHHKNTNSEELAGYPAIDDANGIWNLLNPFRLEIFPSLSDYDFSISYDVAWWNPHYFIACFKKDQLTQLDVDG